MKAAITATHYAILVLFGSWVGHILAFFLTIGTDNSAIYFMVIYLCYCVMGSGVLMMLLGAIQVYRSGGLTFRITRG